MNELRTTALGIGLVLTFGTPAMAVPPTPSPLVNPPRATFVARPERPPGEAGRLYSTRALREMRAYLRLRMLELRERDFDRVRAVLEHRLSIDGLIDGDETPAAPPR
jgi:hypothetical protein